MFGLVRRSRLLEAERRIVSLRVDLVRNETTKQDLLRAIDIEKRLREAAEAERDRLQAILTAHPVETSPAVEAPKQAEPGPPEPIRVLSGIEVVQRAMNHRNAHNQALKSK